MTMVFDVTLTCPAFTRFFMALFIAIHGEKDRQAEKARQAEVETMLTGVPEGEVHMTEACAARVVELGAELNLATPVLRVGVKGGGCSGLTNFFDVVDAQSQTKRDHVFDAAGQRVLCDKRSLKVLSGSLVDFEKGGGRAEFVMHNPRVKSACSCGQSFSV